MVEQTISEYDFLNMIKDSDIVKSVTREEPILFSDKVTKKNHFGFNQERTLIITNKAVYNLKKKELKRRILLNVIRGVTISTLNDEFIIHCNDIEYDYQFFSKRKKIIIEIIAKYYYIETQQELKLFLLPLKSLDTFVTTKKEKKKNMNFSRMPRNGLTSISAYIYGTTSQKLVQQKEATVKKIGKIFSNTNVDNTNFTKLKTIGRGKCGKIILVTYNKTGDSYAIKSIRKDQIVSEDILDNIKLEREILSEGQCEFLLSLSFFYQSPERIYFVTPFIPGGDLYTLLKKKGHLEEDLVRFYTGQIAIAIGHLHEYGIAYRDLKPENILIDEDGYLKLCDFGSSIHMQGTRKEFSFAGSIEYASPEMISGAGHNIMTDWWSFGILLFELLYGSLPFYSLNKKRLFELIMMSEIKFPKFYVNENEECINFKVSDEAKDLILKLLEKEPGERIGKKGLNDIKTHPFFGSLKFDDLKNKKLQSPYKPNVSDEEKFNNFDQEFLDMDVNESKVDEWVNDYKDWFNDFDKNNGEEQEDEDY